MKWVTLSSELLWLITSMRAHTNALNSKKNFPYPYCQQILESFPIFLLCQVDHFEMNLKSHLKEGFDVIKKNILICFHAQQIHESGGLILLSLYERGEKNVSGSVSCLCLSRSSSLYVSPVNSEGRPPTFTVLWQLKFFLTSSPSTSRPQRGEIDRSQHCSLLQACDCHLWQHGSTAILHPNLESRWPVEKEALLSS